MSKSKKKSITYLNPENLTKHPLNIDLYGDEVDQEFVDNIKEEGIQTPITVSGDNVIISGHRRWQAARIVGLKEIPCIVELGLDELETEKLLIGMNRQREKTKEEKAREFKRLKEIESVYAEERMKSGKKADSNPSRNSSEGSKGKASKKAADQVGMSEDTATKASAVVDKIDDLEAEGRTEEAQELRQDLEQSTNKAYKKVKEPADQAPQVEYDGLDPKIEQKSHAALIRYLGAAKKEFEKLKEAKTGDFINSTSITNFNAAITDAVGVIKSVQPHGVCPKCEGKGCKTCKNCGMLPRAQFLTAGGK